MTNTTTTGAALNVTTIRAQRGGHGKGHGPRRTAGLVATATLGLALLAGGVIHQARPATPPAAARAATNPVAGDTYVPSMWDTREDRRVDRLAASFVPDHFTYREDRREGTVAPFVPDQFTYRENRRVDTLPAPFVPDQFTYREDHR